MLGRVLNKNLKVGIPKPFFFNLGVPLCNFAKHPNSQNRSPGLRICS